MTNMPKYPLPPRKDIKNIVELKSPYVSVSGSYGGSQMFFKGLKGPFNKGRFKGGCGVVALNDTLDYLSESKTYNTKEHYMLKFKETSKRMLFIPTRFGMTFIHLFLCAGIMLKATPYKFKCFLGIRTDIFYTRLYNMLSANIPVIICIPKVLGYNKKGRSLPFYDSSLTKVSSAQGHFVVVTGICEIDNKKYLTISSWGNKYFILYDEYISFARKNISSKLGLMLCLKKKQ